MPGITYLDCRSISLAEAGAFSLPAGPTQAMRPFVTIIAACTSAGLPVPSINVKVFQNLGFCKDRGSNQQDEAGKQMTTNSYVHLQEPLTARASLKSNTEKNARRALQMPSSWAKAGAVRADRNLRF